MSILSLSVLIRLAKFSSTKSEPIRKHDVDDDGGGDVEADDADGKVSQPQI